MENETYSIWAWREIALWHITVCEHAGWWHCTCFWAEELEPQKKNLLDFVCELP